MVRILVKGHEAVARTARELFPLVNKANDQPTADLLTQRLDCTRRPPGCCVRCWRSEAAAAAPQGALTAALSLLDVVDVLAASSP